MNNIINFPTLDRPCDFCGAAAFYGKTVDLYRPIDDVHMVLICSDCAIRLVKDLMDTAMDIANQVLEENEL